MKIKKKTVSFSKEVTNSIPQNGSLMPYNYQTADKSPNPHSPLIIISTGVFKQHQGLIIIPMMAIITIMIMVAAQRDGSCDIFRRRLPPPLIKEGVRRCTLMFRGGRGRLCSPLLHIHHLQSTREGCIM